MALLFLIGLVLKIALQIYTYFLWARLILDWVVVLKRGWRPKGVLLIVSEAVYTLTDPPLRMVRKVLPPIRLGTIMLDVAWIVVLIACRILIGVITGILG